MTASIPSTGEQPDPAESLAAIDEQQRRTACALRPSPLAVFLSWGVGYLLAFGALWLRAAHDLLPGWLVAVLVAVALGGALTSTALSVLRSSRGISGPSRRTGAMLGWSWFAGFTAVAVIDVRLGQLGVPGPTMALVWSATMLLVVGLLYLASGALLDLPGQYALGIWILVSAIAAVLVGYPGNFLVLALAGGGGFVVLGLRLHLRRGAA